MHLVQRILFLLRLRLYNAFFCGTKKVVETLIWLPWLKSQIGREVQWCPVFRKFVPSPHKIFGTQPAWPYWPPLPSLSPLLTRFAELLQTLNAANVFCLRQVGFCFLCWHALSAVRLSGVSRQISQIRHRWIHQWPRKTIKRNSTVSYGQCDTVILDCHH